MPHVIVKLWPGKSEQQKTQLAEEIVNSTTHGFGLILSLVGSSVLLGRILAQPDVWRLAGCGVFVTTLVAVYTASTLSHAVSQKFVKPRRQRHMLDAFRWLTTNTNNMPLAREDR